MEDHFTINVARRIKPATERFGPYHEHLCRVTLPTGRTKKEARETYAMFCERFPEPQFQVSMTEVTVRMNIVATSGEQGRSEKR